MTVVNDRQDHLQFKGDVYISKTGDQEESFHFKNLVVDSGKVNIIKRMAGNTAAVMSHIGIGGSNISPSFSDTSLAAQLARVAMTVLGGSPSSNAVSYTANFPAGTGTGVIVEAGIFNNSTGGDMLCRTVFPAITKLAGDSITITWVVTIL